MFLGLVIRGNRVIGATDEGQFTVPINPQTLELESDHGLRVRREHIHIALRQLADIAKHPHSQQFPFKVKEEELLHTFWG